MYCLIDCFFFFKQKTAYEMRISDWSSDVCSSDLSEEKNGPSTSSGQTEHGKSVLASPAVRARARDLGVDLSQVQAEGDRVRHADLDAYLRYSGGQGYHAPGASRARADEPSKVIGMRRKIAENMAASKRAITTFNDVEAVDVS